MSLSLEPLESLKLRYRTAAKAFVLTDYSTAALALEPSVSVSGSVSGPRVPCPEWLEAVERDSASVRVDVERKLAVLGITLLATVHSTPAAVPPTCAALAALVALPAPRLVPALWAELTAAPPSTESQAQTEIFATPRAAFLHPALALALALAALKLDQPRLARAVIEAWFGSVAEQVDRVVYDTVSAPDFDWRDFGVDADSDASMTASTRDLDPRRALVASWLRLYDLLTLHTLPTLGEWEAAADFARGQSAENGGWVPDERVQSSLRLITDAQQQQVLAASSKLQRHRDLESSKLDKQRDKDRRRDKGKSRARDDEDLPLTNGHRSDGSSPSSSPTKPKPRPQLTGDSTPSSSSSAGSAELNPPPPVTGFAAVRSHLSSYLTRTTDAAPPAPAPAPLRSVAAYIRHHYATDPVRLLTLICFIFAFSSWVRRTVLVRRARGEAGIGIGIGSVAAAMRLAFGRVAETVRMGTKVTSL